MSLNTLVDYISNSQITSELIKRISKNNELNIIGSSRYAKSIILDSIAKKEEKNILLICPNVEIAYKWIGYFESINDKEVLYYPPTEHLPYSSINKSKEIEFSQLTVLSKLLKKEKNELNIVIPIFKALDLNSELSRDLVREASATALSADNNNSRAINIGKSVKISYQLSTWSSVGIKEFIAAESIKYYSQSV